MWHPKSSSSSIVEPLLFFKLFFLKLDEVINETNNYAENQIRLKKELFY